MSTAAILIAAPTSAAPRPGAATGSRHSSTGPAEESFAAALDRAGAQSTSPDPALPPSTTTPDSAPQDETGNQGVDPVLTAALLAGALPTHSAPPLNAPDILSATPGSPAPGAPGLAPAQPLTAAAQGATPTSNPALALTEQSTPDLPASAPTAGHALAEMQPVQGTDPTSAQRPSLQALDLDAPAQSNDALVAGEAPSRAQTTGPRTDEHALVDDTATERAAPAVEAAPTPSAAQTAEADSVSTLPPTTSPLISSATSAPGAAAPTNPTAPASFTTQVARPEATVALSALPDRISEHVTALTSGTDRVALRLSPAHLGSVQLVLTHTPDGVAVLVRADSSALASLAGIERAVRTTLEHSGAPIASFTFDASTSERHAGQHQRERMPAPDWFDDAGHSAPRQGRYVSEPTHTASTEILL